MPSGVFYSVLDSVNFNPLRPRRDLEQVRIAAAGSLMLGVLIGNVRPVMTDAQIFDNTLVIDTVAAFDRETEAFLSLIREGRLQARVLQTAGLEADSSRRISLTDSFIAALNRPTFVFSAWPDLEDSSIRETVAAVLAAGADPLRELDSPELARRIIAIRELSDSFDAATKGNGLPLVGRPIFGNRLRSMIENLRLNPETQGAADWLLGAITEKAGSLEYRSTWYRLIGAAPDSVVDTVRRATLLDGVNGIYNEAVSHVLNCDPDVSFSGREVVEAAANAGLNGQWGVRAVRLARDPSVQNVMTWSTVRQTLPHLEPFAAPQARLSYLINELGETLGRDKFENSTATWLRVKAPHQVLGKVATIGAVEAGIAVTTALGSSPLAQALGALVGVITVFGGTPAVKRILAERERRVEARQIADARVILTRNSSAWQGRIDNP